MPPKGVLSIKQGMEACHIVAEIPTWMGNLAKFTVWTVSLREANDLVVGLKRLEKENYQKVQLELNSKLSAMRLGQTQSSLSTSAKPLIPLVALSATVAGPPWGGSFPPPGQDMEPTRPFIPLIMRALLRIVLQSLGRHLVNVAIEAVGDKRTTLKVTWE